MHSLKFILLCFMTYKYYFRLDYYIIFDCLILLENLESDSKYKHIPYLISRLLSILRYKMWGINLKNITKCIKRLYYFSYKAN